MANGSDGCDRESSEHGAPWREYSDIKGVARSVDPPPYRTLAAASGRTGPGTIEWRLAELARRAALERSAVDAAARRMVEEELARAGLGPTA